MALPDAMTLATRAEIQAVRDGLAFLSAAAERGRFSWDDYETGIAACDAVAKFVAQLRAALNGYRSPDNLVLLCEKDRQPHTATFHALHTEAP